MNHLIPISFVAIAGISAFSALGDATSQSITGRTFAASANTSVELEMSPPQVGSRSNAAVASALRTFERLSRFPYSRVPDGKVAKTSIRIPDVRQVARVLDEQGGFNDVLRALGRDPSEALSEADRLGIENAIDLYFNGFRTPSDRGVAVAAGGLRAVGQEQRIRSALQFIYFNDRTTLSSANRFTRGTREILDADYLKRTDVLKRALVNVPDETAAKIRSQFANLVDDESGLNGIGRTLDEDTIFELAMLYGNYLPSRGRSGLPDITSRDDGVRAVLQALANGESEAEAYSKTYVAGAEGFATVILLRELKEVLEPDEVAALVNRSAEKDLEDVLDFVNYPPSFLERSAGYADKLAAAQRRLPRELIARVQAYDTQNDALSLFAPETFRYSLGRAQQANESPAVPESGPTRLTRPEDVAAAASGFDEANEALARIRRLLPETAGMALDEALASLRRARREVGPVDIRKVSDEVQQAANEIKALLGDAQ